MGCASNNGTAQAQDIPALPYQCWLMGRGPADLLKTAQLGEKTDVLVKGDLGSISARASTAVWRDEKDPPRHLLLLLTEISCQAVPLTPGQVFRLCLQHLKVNA